MFFSEGGSVVMTEGGEKLRFLDDVICERPHIIFKNSNGTTSSVKNQNLRYVDTRHTVA